MKAYIFHNWPKDGYDIYLFRESMGGKRRPIVLDGSDFVYSDVEFDVGQDLPPTLFLSNLMYEALRQAMIGDAIDQDDALKDTRMIRDRLLAMVESEWQSRQLEKQ